MRRTITSLLALALAASPLVGLAGGEDAVLRAGVATEDITWHPGAGQTGFGERWRPFHLQDQGVETNMYARLMKPSEGVHMRLRTKAVVIDDGTEKVAIVSNDLLGTIQIFHRGVAQQIAEDPGIPWDNLLMVGTHSESVPSNGSISPLIAAYADVFDEEFYRYVITKAVTAIRRAAAALEPVRFAVGTIAGGNMIETFVGGNVSEHLDDDLGVARIDRLDGSTMAVMLTYAGHFVLGGNDSMLISSDGPGYWERMVEARIAALPSQRTEPVTAIYLTGPTGDSDVRSVQQPNLYAEGELKALRLTGPTMDLFADLADETSADVTVNSRALRLNPPQGHEVPNFPLLAGAPIPFFVSHRMHAQVVQIGELVLGGVPGEPVMMLGKVFKDEVKRLGFAHPFMLSHANDWTGYIYTPEQYAAQQGRSDQGAYGPNQGAYIVEKLVGMTHNIVNPDFHVNEGAAGPLQTIDDPYYDLATTLLLTTAPATSELRDAAIVPNVVMECAGLAQPTAAERFSETRFTWRGGNNAVDTPHVELQRQVGSEWVTVAVDDGFELQTWLEVYKVRPAAPYLPGTTPGCNELVDQEWSAAFQPAYDWPTGTYRLRATGLFRSAPKSNEAYESFSEPFAVTPSNDLEVTDVMRTGPQLRFRVRYPNGPEGWRYRPPFVTTGTAAVTIGGVPAGEATVQPDGWWLLETALTGPVDVSVADAWGNTN